MRTAYSEITNSIPGLTNYVVPIPGSDVVAHLGVWSHTPARWLYSLWTGHGDSEELIESGILDLSEVGPDGTPIDLTPDQVGRIVFILDVEYA